MIQQVHEHILEELKTNTKTDTIFVITAILLNLITLSINSAISSDSQKAIIVMFIFVALIIVINLVAEIGLIKGRQTRTKLIGGLIRMYKDHGVDQYYDPSLLGAYKTRYTLFMATVLFTGIIAIVIPFVIM
jgi:hypothetical protein